MVEVAAVQMVTNQQQFVTQSATATSRSIPASLRRGIVWSLVFFVRFYQAYIRPHLLGQCKFHPTCSHYAIEALQKRGPISGLCLAVRRLARCHPFTRGGYDPVPPVPRYSRPDPLRS